MAILGFTGKLPVAVAIAWKGDIIPNALTTALKDEQYVLANESITELSVKALIGGSLRVVQRKATASQRLYDEKLNLYVSNPLSSATVEELLALPKGAKLRLDMTFTFNTFFEALLVQMTRNDADLHNLANPNDSKAILDTFKHSTPGGKVKIEYTPATQRITTLECTLVDVSATMPAGAKVPAVKLALQIDFGSNPDATQQSVMRKLIAMDWSKLARFGVPDSKRPDVSIWAKNVFIYLCNHTDVTRGERFRKTIQDRHVGKSPLQLSTDLREDLDLHLITANHWGQAREDLKTETHQRLLSDLFGTLHQKTFLSSPVAFQRSISKAIFSDDIDKTAALALQYGTGHCGEHATCSFSVLRGIMQSPGNQVKAVIFSGNANIDHAFVVYNLDLKATLLTRATSAKNSRVKAGQNIRVFNLKDTIAANAPTTGFVMDPYLDKSVMKATAAELLIALNSQKRKNQGKDTDFLAFNAFFPPPQPTDTDVRGQSDTQLKALIKNV